MFHVLSNFLCYKKYVDWLTSNNNGARMRLTSSGQRTEYIEKNHIEYKLPFEEKSIGKWKMKAETAKGNLTTK